MKIDTCLLTGPCPFRPLHESGSPGALLERLGLGTGLFLSFPALFYHRPQTGLEQTLGSLPESDPPTVWHHGVFNPMVSEGPEGALFQNTGGRVRSVLLAPALHHYSLNEPGVRQLLDLATEQRLSVVLYRHLCDPRLVPDWLVFRDEPIESLAEWVKKAPASCRLVLSHFFPHELDRLLPVAARREGVYVEVGAYSGSEGWYARALSSLPRERWLYGSGAPLRYALGNRMALEAAAREVGLPLEQFDRNARDCYGI